MAESSPRHKILVVGGYGQVGRVVSAQLARTFPGEVIVAGRDPARAGALAREIAYGTESARLDLSQIPDSTPLLDEVRLAVVCIEQADSRFARLCLSRGVHYVDISAGYAILRQIEGLHDLAQARQATAVLSVGLCPGLTNLMARHVSSFLDTTEAIDISLLLGLGDAHGADAVRWLLRNAARPFTVETPGGPRVVRSLSDPRSVLLPSRFGRRTLYRFDLADQHVLRRTLGVPRVESRLCFDSALATSALALLGRLGVLAYTRRLSPRLVGKVLARVSLGGDGFVAQVEAAGLRDHQPLRVRGAVFGRGEARATGVVTAITAEMLLAAPRPDGVYHSEELFEPRAILDRCQQAGIDVAVDAPQSQSPGGYASSAVQPAEAVARR